MAPIRTARSFAFFGALICFFPFLLGCEASLTHRLWTQGEFRGLCRPAPEVRLRLYDLPQKKDILVIYDELSDRNGDLNERAYLLRESAARLARGKKPDFLKPTQFQILGNLLAYDLTSGPEAVPSFRLRDHSVEQAPLFAGEVFFLPVYRDHTGYPALAALTPLAVAADISAVGLCVGLVGLYSYAQGFNYR